MSLALHHTQLSLGITTDINSALTVDLIPVAMPIISTSMGTEIKAAFCDIDSEQHFARIIALLKPMIEQQLADNVIDLSITPIYWLLPELAIEDNQSLIEWANLLKQHFPTHFVHAKTQFFPYGSSAIVMALKAAEYLLVNEEAEQVCFIAVDSLYHQLDELLVNDACLTLQNEDGLIPSEGAIVTCVSLASEGINLLMGHSERATSHQVIQSVESLFHAAVQRLKEQKQDTVISSVYAPSNGLTKNTMPWVEAYRRLAGHVNRDTRLKQLPLLTGELGCVTGLYHFLHIYHAYQHRYITGNTLQLEMSARLYQAVNLYSWTGKDAR